MEHRQFSAYLSTMMLSLVATLAIALTEPPASRHAFDLGGAVAPAALNSGSLAFYGQLGAPDLALGYRQGFSLLEVEVRAVFNYLDLSVFADGGIRVPLFRGERWIVAPGASLGLKYGSGNRYFDRQTFQGWSLRPRAQFTASYLLQETIQLLGTIDLPLSVLTTLNGYQVVPTLGGGAEFHLGGRLSISVLGSIGLDLLREPLGVPQARLAWGFRVALGYRVF
jgi:hypothetical protein